MLRRNVLSLLIEGQKLPPPFAQTENSAPKGRYFQFLVILEQIADFLGLILAGNVHWALVCLVFIGITP